MRRKQLFCLCVLLSILVSLCACSKATDVDKESNSNQKENATSVKETGKEDEVEIIIGEDEVETITGEDEEPGKTETNNKHKHSYSSVVTTEATCTREGVKTYTCNECGTSYTESIAAKGHKYSAATCTKGSVCTSCGDKQGTALGHDHEMITGKCSRCGLLVSATIEFPSLPIAITNYNSDNEPSLSYEIIEISSSVHYYWPLQEQINYHINFKGICTYNKDGVGEDELMRLDWKLYDSAGKVVDDGYHYVEGVAEGEEFTAVFTVWKVQKGGRYRLHFE